MKSKNEYVIPFLDEKGAEVFLSCFTPKYDFKGWLYEYLYNHIKEGNEGVINGYIDCNYDDIIVENVKKFIKTVLTDLEDFEYFDTHQEEDVLNELASDEVPFRITLGSSMYIYNAGEFELEDSWENAMILLSFNGSDKIGISIYDILDDEQVDYLSKFEVSTAKSNLKEDETYENVDDYGHYISRFIR